MKDKQKTKNQQINELEKLRHRISELEKTETERKRAKEGLKESEERYRELVEKAGIAILVDDKEGNIKYANKRAAEFYGYSLEEMKKQSIKSLVHPDDVKMVTKFHKDRLEGKRIPSSYVFKGVKKDGSIRYFEIDVTANKKRDSITETRMYLKDITKQKQAEEALKESEEKFRNIFESVAEGLTFMDRTGRIIDVNEQAAKIYGGPKEELLGKHFTKVGVVSFKDIPVLLRKFASILTGNKPTIYIKIKNKKGKEIDLECSGSVIKKDNRPAFVNVIVRDITEYKKAEKALRKSEEKYRSLFELAPDSIITLDLKGVVTSCNNTVLRRSGYSKDELVGKHFTKIGVLRKKDIPKYLKVFSSLLRGKIPASFEFPFRHKDESTKWGEAHMSILKVDGRKVGIQAILRDITERKMTEEKIKIHQEKLRSLASRLSLAEEEERRRLATMLHDNLGQKLALAKIKLGVLREPLSATDLVKNIDEIRELIQEAIQDTSSLTFELSPPILYELGLTAAMEWLTEQIQDKYNIQIGFKDDGQPAQLGNDIRIALFQAMRELLINAVKHSQANKVKVSSRGDGKKIRIRVEDDGIGFKVSEMQPYFVKTGGFGLFNIHERLEQLGGHMEIESKPGLGTTVTLVAPLEGGEKISKQK